MARCGLEVADVFRRYGEAFREHHGASLSTAQRHVMSAIEMCRTAALGGHIEQCDHCDHQRISYNSCVMGKFRNGELTIDSVAKLTVFPVILSDQSALYSPLQRLTAEIREARDRSVDDSAHSQSVAADWTQEISRPLNLHVPEWSARISMRSKSTLDRRLRERPFDPGAR